MSKYDVNFIGKKANEMGFIRDTLEKVIRLVDILEFLNNNPILKNSLALKGGTAINLTIFNLPRLSVDIDLDYIQNESKDIMLKNRNKIGNIIQKYMQSQNYEKSSKSKEYPILDSWVYNYINAAGNKDNIKIEINYSLRAHLFEPEERIITIDHFSDDIRINSLLPMEIFASKVVALLDRAAARDLYDIYNMIDYKLFNNDEKKLLKKCIIFYTAIASANNKIDISRNAIDTIDNYKIKTQLLPVIRKRDLFELDIVKKIVNQYLNELMVLSKNEKKFLEKFNKNQYIPELIFDNPKIISRIKDHPMAIWKMQ